MKSRWVALAVAGLFIALPACRFDGLAFREDDRVEIVAPEDRAEVTLPFQVQWTVTDFERVGTDGSDRNDAGSFAVLLDTSPMPPGEGLEYFAANDESCRPQAGCPDIAYLNDRNIYLTSETSFNVDVLEDTRPTDRPSAIDEHEITIILLNGRNERVGESAFRVSVIVDRGQA